MAVDGIVGLLNDDRSGTTHLLVDLARTSAGCDCVVRSPLLHAVGSLNAFITEGIGKRKGSPRDSSSLSCMLFVVKLFRVFYFRGQGGPRKYFDNANFQIYGNRAGMGNTVTLHPNSCFCSFSIPTS